MDTASYIIGKIEAWNDARKRAGLTVLSDRKFSLLATGYDAFMRRLRAGDGVSTRTIERAEAYMARNMPPAEKQGGTDCD